MAFFFGNGGFPFGGGQGEEYGNFKTSLFKIEIWLFILIEEFAGGRGGREKKEIDNTKYYKLLNSTKEST